MKTILWICNTPLPEIQQEVRVKNFNEGWLIGISEQLRKREDIVFHYAFPQNVRKRTINRTINGITFWGFYNSRKNLYDIKKENIQFFTSIIKKINPDIIHIFGTELPHALECVNSIPDKAKFIVSIQGLTSEIARVYMQGIPIKDRLLGKFKRGKYHCLLTEQYGFYRRGMNESNLLRNVTNVIGRTDWDKKCVNAINFKCRYYLCNETLRDIFYYDNWNIEKIQRHSIFISQASYPIKGLHILITALPLIKKKYPDVMVYVSGSKAFLENDTPYGRCIKNMLRKYRVEKAVSFLGFLDDEGIKKRLLSAHVMLMPSLIENSPNSVGEAMLIGTPVVAARVGGIPSILNDKTEGYLYDSTNKAELAQKINTIFKNNKLAVQFSKNGRKRARELYNKTENAEQLLKIYEDVAERG